jgi:hypothetical protein
LKHPFVLWTLLFLLACFLQGDLSSIEKSALRSHLDLPAAVLWAWERPEDLRGLDPSRFGVAYLDQTIEIRDRVVARSNLNQLQVNDQTRLMAVVRIEMHPNADATDASLPARVATLIVRSARGGKVRAMQIDFDARLSQRPFYRELLMELRKQMPASMPLSITALASWCGHDNWLQGLPIDEAVPMFFRMGKTEAAHVADGRQSFIHEPRCQGSAGVSTDEPWPKMDKEARIYVFHPRAWSSVALKNVEEKIYP